MRDLNECKAEIFRRSEKRIRERRKKSSRIIALCFPLCITITMGLIINMTKTPAPYVDYQEICKEDAATQSKNEAEEEAAKPNNGFYEENEEVPNSGESVNDNSAMYSLEEINPLDGFQFSLVWSCYGDSSYDSESGKLIKSKIQENPEDYITVCHLTDSQKKKIYDLIQDLDITSYPDEYNPHDDSFMTCPPMTLVLSVKTNSFEKTVAANDIAFGFNASNGKGQKFLNTCQAIINILTETGEWKALPEIKRAFC